MAKEQGVWIDGYLTVGLIQLGLIVVLLFGKLASYLGHSFLLGYIALMLVLLVYMTYNLNQKVSSRETPLSSRHGHRRRDDNEIRGNGTFRCNPTLFRRYDGPVFDRM